MKIIYISLVDWYWIKQRPQHFVELLSKMGNEVVYLCSKPWKNNLGNNLNKIKINCNLDIIRKRTFPINISDKIRVLKIVNNLIMKCKIKSIDENIETIIITHPRHIEYIPKDLLIKCKIIYDCMDDYGKFKCGGDELIKKLELKTIMNVDKVIVSSSYLKSQILNKYSELINEKRIEVIENGVDINNFDLSKLKYLKDVNSIDIYEDKINMVYIGTVAEWFDVETIEYAAKTNSNIIINIIGPIDSISEDFKKLYRYQNIKILGKRPYEEIPHILSKMDIAIMPFIVNDVVKAVNPVKIYEYLSMGMPVISVKYNETEKFGEKIYLYSNKYEFVKKIEDAMENKFDQSRIEYAQNNTWQKRVDKLYEIILND